MPQPILVVDFGAQYSQLIARRVREAKVYSEIIPHTATAAEIAAREPAGLIFSGGPQSVYADEAPTIDPDVYKLGIPILGICYGAQLIALQLGGKVERTGKREYGRTELTVDGGSVMFGFKNGARPVWMSHADAITAAPDGFYAVGSSAGAPVAVMEDNDRMIYGVQFHPEVSHTPEGQKLIQNFLYQVCACRPYWSPASIIDEAVEAIRAQVGDRPVICGLSGGVDSSVAAALVHRAIGDQLTCVYVDNGLMRQNETEQVERTFRDHFGIKLISVDARSRFLSALEGVEDPEGKRKIIGETFYEVFWDEATQLNAQYLVQGTLYPDHIESGPGGAATIKTHHNRVKMPEGINLELVEPLAQLFKDEVRVIGEELGLPEEIVWRQPFPGPGLGIRVIGPINEERLQILRAADGIFTEEVWAAGLHRQLWQYFCVLPVVKSVGVMGDGRTYAHPIVLRAVESDDAMTADWSYLPRELIERVTDRIIGEVHGVNRVVLDVTSKPPGTIEWE